MKLASFKISKERVLLNWQLKATVSVEIVGTFYCLLDRPLNVGAQIWWVNCNKQYFGGKGTGKKEKKQRLLWKRPNNFCPRL